jgi:predicted alpha/beta superfamily hydrolase
MKKIFLSLIDIFRPISVVKPKYEAVTISNSEFRKITSKIVIGQEYELHISLPFDYGSSDKKYPVVYVLDSHWDFPLVYSIYGANYYDGFIPELIVVGVSAGGENPDLDKLRNRDFIPSHNINQKQSGGADNFLDFMNVELFPFIEINYSIDNKNSTLMGASMSALLILYAMLTRTDMFTSYVAGSPILFGWDYRILYQYEKVFTAKIFEKPVRLYITFGDLERGRPIFEELNNFLIGIKNPNFMLRSKVIKNCGHSSIKPSTYAGGLKYIFKRNQLILNNDLLNKYVGTYQFANGNKIDIKKEENQLICVFSEYNIIPIFANTENHFYSKQEFFNVYFKDTDEMNIVLFVGNHTLKKLHQNSNATLSSSTFS